jgi:hypothetical protein
MVGLKEFTRDLRRVDKEFPRQVARAMRKAAKHVEGDARSRYARRYRQGASGRSTRSVKGIAAFASSWEAGIKFGDDRRPWLIGQEFGSNRYQQFRPWTGAGPGGKGSHGRFIWPAIREEMDTVSDQLADDLMGILRGATA